MPREIPHKAIALLDKHSDEQNLQGVSGYVAAVCTEAGVMVITDAPELKDHG